MCSAHRHGAGTGGDTPWPAPLHPPPQSPLGLPPPPAANFPAGHFRSSCRRRNEWKDAVFPRRKPGRGNPGRGSGQGRESPGRDEGLPPAAASSGPAAGRGARHCPPPLSPALRRRRRLPSGARSGGMAPGKSLCVPGALAPRSRGREKGDYGEWRRKEMEQGDHEGRRSRGRWRPRSCLSPRCSLSPASEAALRQGGTFKNYFVRREVGDQTVYCLT